MKQYATDTDCFVTLMEKFNQIYKRYPKYPITAAVYGSYNNYLYCEQHGMEKFMKFTMFEKETKNEKTAYGVWNKTGDCSCTISFYGLEIDKEPSV